MVVRIVFYLGAFLSAGCRTQAHLERSTSRLVFSGRLAALCRAIPGQIHWRLTLSLKTWKESLPREKSGRILACSPQLIGITCPEILSHPAST